MLERYGDSMLREKSEKKARKESQTGRENVEEVDEDDEIPAADAGMLSLVDLREKLRSAFAETKGQEHVWADIIEKIAAFGPRRTGARICSLMLPKMGHAKDCEVLHPSILV